MAALHPTPSTPASPLFGGGDSRSTVGTGSTASGSIASALRMAPSKASSSGSAQLGVAWEEGLPRLDPFSDWRITPEGEVQWAGRAGQLMQ